MVEVSDFSNIINLIVIGIIISGLIFAILNFIRNTIHEIIYEINRKKDCKQSAIRGLFQPYDYNNKPPMIFIKKQKEKEEKEKKEKEEITNAKFQFLEEKYEKLQLVVKDLEEKQLFAHLVHLGELITNDNGQNKTLYETHKAAFSQKCKLILSMNKSSTFKQFGLFIRNFETSMIAKNNKEENKEIKDLNDIFISCVRSDFYHWIKSISE